MTTEYSLGRLAESAHCPKQHARWATILPDTHGGSSST
jgi:hypothetical protein